MISKAGVALVFEKTTTIFAWLTPTRYRDLKRYYHWPDMKKDVATFISQ